MEESHRVASLIDFPIPPRSVESEMPFPNGLLECPWEL